MCDTADLLSSPILNKIQVAGANTNTKTAHKITSSQKQLFFTVIIIIIKYGGGQFAFRSPKCGGVTIKTVELLSEYGGDKLYDKNDNCFSKIDTFSNQYFKDNCCTWKYLTVWIRHHTSLA